MIGVAILAIRATFQKKNLLIQITVVVYESFQNIYFSADEGGIQCCLGNGQDMLPPELMNDKCIPICVPDNDPFYRRYGIKCINFVRSITTPRDDCSLGHAEQVSINKPRTSCELMNIFTRPPRLFWISQCHILSNLVNFLEKRFSFLS